MSLERIYQAAIELLARGKTAVVDEPGGNSRAPLPAKCIILIPLPKIADVFLERDSGRLHHGFVTCNEKVVTIVDDSLQARQTRLALPRDRATARQAVRRLEPATSIISPSTYCTLRQPRHLLASPCVTIQSRATRDRRERSGDAHGRFRRAEQQEAARPQPPAVTICFRRRK